MKILNNFFAVVFVLLFGIFSSSAIAHEATGIHLEFAGDTMIAYPGPPPLWRTKVPAGLDKNCLFQAAESQGKAVLCSTEKKIEMARIKFDWVPLSLDRVETQYQVTVDSGQASFSKQEKRSTITDPALSFIWFYLPAIVLLVASILNIKRGAGRKKLLHFYLAVTAVALVMGITGVITSEVTACLIAGVVIGIIAGVLTGNGLDPLASILAGSFAGGFAAQLGWQNGAITEYLVFLTSVCLLWLLLRETAVFIADRKKAKQEKLCELPLEHPQ